MGKKRSNSRIRRKIRRLERRLRRSSSDYEEGDRYQSSDSEGRAYSGRSDLSPDVSSVRSQVVLPQTELPVADETTNILPPEILEALGDPKSKDKTSGPPISEEISKRWGRVIIEGMTKEAKESTIQKALFPENFSLAKAPLLNMEIAAVLSDPVKSRDKLLEKAQNHLGLGIASLTYLASELIEKDLDKVYLISKISEISQIFCDLHFENTKSRRKLVTNSLDKKFNNMVADVRRDEYLFGTGLGEKIKASKTAERSGFQIKRAETRYHTNKASQENWRGPPRNQSAARPPRQGGPRNRYQPYQPRPTRRPFTATNRTANAPTPLSGPRKP